MDLAIVNWWTQKKQFIARQNLFAVKKIILQIMTTGMIYLSVFAVPFFNISLRVVASVGECVCVLQWIFFCPPSQFHIPQFEQTQKHGEMIFFWTVPLQILRANWLKLLKFQHVLFVYVSFNCFAGTFRVILVHCVRGTNLSPSGTKKDVWNEK